MRRSALTVALAILSFVGLVLAAAPRALAAQPAEVPATSEQPAAAEHPGADAPQEHAEKSEGINWYYGFIAEKEGAKPSLLWRPKGMEPPLFAEVFDALILVLARFQDRAESPWPTR